MASLGSATDPAALAARCALCVLERWPEAVVVLTTGCGSLDSHLPVGEPITARSRHGRPLGRSMYCISLKKHNQTMNVRVRQ
jgi:hypothetical protein